MKAILALCLFVTFFTGCRKNQAQETECIDGSVEHFKTEANCEHGASVKVYEFVGRTVYVFHPGDCGADMQAKVMDANCHVLGYLGGISGNTKINGVEFSSNAYYLRTVWNN